MRTGAWETAPQIALRNCSKEVEGREDSVYVILVKGEYMDNAIKARIFCRSFLLVMRTSHHHEGF